MFPNFVYVCKCVSICTYDFEMKILQILLKIFKLKARIMSYGIGKNCYIEYFDELRFKRFQEIEEQRINIEKCKSLEITIKNINNEIDHSNSLLKNYFNHFEFYFKDYYLSAENLQR
ncbi:hypothetical protein GVAV_000925 [Gurleya vavrai]